MDIQYIANAKNSSIGAAGGSYTLTPPAMQKNDLCVVASGFSWDSSGVALPIGNNYGTYVAAGGALFASDAVSCAGRVAYAIQGDTPDTAITVDAFNDASCASCSVCMVFRGVDPITPMDATPATATGANTGRPDPPSITPVTAGALLVACGFGTDDVTPVALTAPSGYSNLANQSGANTYGFNAAMALKLWSGSGADDPGSFGGGNVLASRAWCAVTLALRPSPFIIPSVAMIVQV